MPGMAGFTRLNGSDERDARTVSSMSEAMRGTASQVADVPFINHEICMARTTPSAGYGRQPPFVQDGIHVWLDGEIIAPEMGEANHERRRNSTQLLANGFRDGRDLGFLAGIDGVFAFAVYDSKRKKLYLGSDRYGLRHLNWTVQCGRLVWASELKALLELPGFQARIDRRSLEEFLGIGWFLDNGTWFEGVELLPPATVLMWDLKRRRHVLSRYWSWDRVERLPDGVKEQEIAEELGRRFRQAVRRRRSPGERVGVTLSGGLDSRAIFAAVPEDGTEAKRLHAVTFGKADCDDLRIAARVAAVRKDTIHHRIELDESNWLDRKIEAIWWTDGRKDIKHMAILPAYVLGAELFDRVLDGAGAAVLKGTDVFDPNDPIEFLRKRFGCRIPPGSDLENRVGSYARKHGSLYSLFLDTRVRSFGVNGPKLATFQGLEYRLPFFDNDFQEFLCSVPLCLRRNGRLAFRMLNNEFPEFFHDIPWQKTGTAVGNPPSVRRVTEFINRAKFRARRDLRKWGVDVRDVHATTDYAAWLRVEPARGLVAGLLESRSALYPEFVSRDRVLHDWREHLKGEDCSTRICRYLTFEVWLQQVYLKSYRAGQVERDSGQNPRRSWA